MKPFHVLFFLFLAVLGAGRAAPEVVSFDVQKTSMSGGPAEDVIKKASEFFSMPELASPELNMGSVLQKKFPRGMKKAELLPLLRKIRIQHVCDTDMRDSPEGTAGGVLQLSRIEFDVKNYVRVRTQASTVGARTEESVLEEAFTLMFRFAKNGDLTEVLSWSSSVPL